MSLKRPFYLQRCSVVRYIEIRLAHLPVPTALRVHSRNIIVGGFRVTSNHTLSIEMLYCLAES